MTAVAIVGPATLRLRFDDGTQQIVDLREALEGELFGPLRDPDLFAQVSIDPESGTIEWPTGADFDPETLHDWPELGPEWIEMARTWRSRTVVRG